MKLIHVIAILSLSMSASVFAANSDQAAIDTLQKQITSVQTEMNAAMTKQDKSTQKAIADLQTLMQTQVTNLQNEMQKMQTQLNNEIKQVQTEAVKSSGAPVVTATPGVTEPAK